MSEFLNCEQNKNRTEMFCFVLSGACISLVLILLYVFGSAPVKKGELADSDCYMRLLRVRDLHSGGRWYDPVVLRSNAPHGERLHWTRPFDILLLLGAAPIALFTDFESALFWWGVVVSPILMIAALIALQWSTRPILSKDGPFLAGFVFVFQLMTLTYYQAGRPDHHSLLVFVFVLSIGLTLRMILRPFKTLLCYMTGAIIAFSIWISVESMLLTCIILGVLGLFWVLENGDFSRKSLHCSLALFVCTGLNMILERPWYDLTTKEFDRLSIVHWSILGFITVFWIAASTLNRYTSLFRRVAYRFSFLLAGAATIALAILLCFPKFYRGPFVDVDPRIVPIWLSKVREVQPLLSKSAPLAILVQLIGSAIVGLPFLLYLLLRNTQNENRKGWIYILLSPVVFTLVSLYQIRWLVYAQVLLIIPMTELMSRVLVWQQGRKKSFWRALRKSLVILTFSAGFLFLGLLADVVFKRGGSERSKKETSLIEMCKYLTEAQKWPARNLRILTHVNFGAEILYRTHHEVIATPYHRNGPGILDTYDTMTADTDEKALELVRKRKIDLILLCPKSSESALYSKPEPISTFYERLSQDIIPDWLHKVELPSDLSSSFLLFEVMEK